LEEIIFRTNKQGQIMYYDKDNFIHDRAPATSGNKILYTSYAIALGMYNTEEISKLKVKAQGLIIDNVVTQRDNNNDSLDSLDNIIGFIYLGLLTPSNFEKTSWYFNGYDKNRHSWKECITDLIAIHGEDRNFWHENGFDAVGKLANLVSPHVRYYAKRKSGDTSIHLAPFFYLWVISTLLKSNYKKGIRQTGNISQKNIAWLVLKDLKSKYLIKLFNLKKNFTDYFGSQHPIVNKLG
jgi:hypothetical protein